MTFLVTGCGLTQSHTGMMKIRDGAEPSGYLMVDLYTDVINRTYYYHDGRVVYVDESPGSVTEPRAPGKPDW
jgi:hypothetical protein